MSTRTTTTTGRTLGSSPWFNPRGTLADDNYGDNHGAIDPLAGRHGVAERVAKVSSDARRAYEENELGSQLPRSAPPSAPSVLHPKIISATTGKNGVKRKTRPLHRAPDAADDELMAVVMKKVRQTKGKIWLTEDALGENPRESNARLAPTYKAEKQPSQAAPPPPPLVRRAQALRGLVRHLPRPDRALRLTTGAASASASAPRRTTITTPS